MVGEFIKESSRINGAFNTRYINLLASKNVSDSGKVSIGKIMVFISIWFQLLKELSNNKPDLCYLALSATGAAFFRDVLLVSLLKVFGVRRVYHMHNKGVKTHGKQKLYDFFYSFMFKDTDVIMLSEYLYEDVDDYVGKQQVHVCPNGIPEPDYVESEESEKEVSLLFLSNLIESKGVYVLLEACEKLREKGLSFKCTFIGGEGDVSEPQINQVIKERGLEKQVVYAGKKYGEEKEKAFSKADIFVFPTFYDKECLPLVLIEAMQHRLPVVSTYEGGIRDLVDSGKTGYLVEQKNVEELSEKLEELIRDKELRQKMGKAGREKYEARFTLQKFEERMTEILTQVVQKS
ncbi:Glycosyltransferase involved in cell wall bisynthesis [Gracilimonas mengyeensis]|uniref:Glycosyltransferase involved in cell wall bisynthesis n=2 Tax=Gracilimonas mengyeensis TaxID=1302730 RepID=A0A521FKG7_9BACT|nr:Glycosyltransferase involved in cell wall bisynthesis [Gracilimonas mengyeensis]